ncbi:MAG: DUF6599 family protein [Puniceicoccaceae bacterium]
MKANLRFPGIRLRKVAREEIPSFEQFLGGLILLLIVVIGIGIYVKGKIYDPHTYALDPAALESTRSEVLGKAATVVAEGTSERIGGVVAAAAGAAPVKVLPPMADGFNPMGDTEHYVPDTLFEKINGRAPAYLAFNFQELTTRSFTLDSAAGQFVDVFIFSMDTPKNAFGIFSMERDGSGATVDFVTDGYRSEMGFFYRQGNAYVQVLASDSSAAVMTPAEAFAKALAASLPVDDSGLGASLLPTKYQVANSLNFIQSNAYGLSLMKDVYEAKYNVGGTVLTYFAMDAGSEADAAAAWEEIKGYHTKYADVQQTGDVGGGPFIVSDNFGDWNVLFMNGTILGGVVDSSDRALSYEFVEAQLTGAELDYAEQAPSAAGEGTDAAVSEEGFDDEEY